MTLEGSVRYVPEAVRLLVYFASRKTVVILIRGKSQSVRRVGADAPHYVCALSIYHKALLSAVDLADSLKYNDALKLKERAFRMLASARGDYWNHVSKHGCRPEPSC